LNRIKHIQLGGRPPSAVSRNACKTKHEPIRPELRQRLNAPLETDVYEKGDGRWQIVIAGRHHLITLTGAVAE
jgi:hypothetical protein